MKRILLVILTLSLLISGCLMGCSKENEYGNSGGRKNLGNSNSNSNSDNKTSSTEEIIETPIKYSEGLEYVLSTDRTYMVLAGMGTCKDTTIAIPPTYNDLPVKEITGGAFRPSLYESTPRVVEVIIPDSIIRIGGDAFRSCEHLSKVHIGRGVLEIGDDAFYNCSEPLNIFIKDMASFCNIKLTNFLGGHVKNEYNLYLNGELVEELIIPDSVTNIGDFIFSACISIKKVVLGKSVVSIGKYAFWNCKNLSEIAFNNSLNCIDTYAFTGCKILMKATFKNTSNWIITDNWSQDSKSLSSGELANASTAAKYLADDYRSYKWERK